MWGIMSSKADPGPDLSWMECFLQEQEQELNSGPMFHISHRIRCIQGAISLQIHIHSHTVPC